MIFNNCPFCRNQLQLHGRSYGLKTYACHNFVERNKARYYDKLVPTLHYYMLWTKNDEIVKYGIRLQMTKEEKPFVWIFYFEDYMEVRSLGDLIISIPKILTPDYPSLNKLREKMKFYMTFS